MVMISPILPAPATKTDAAPKTSPRADPGSSISTDKAAVDAEPVAERRRNPERRRSRNGRIMDQRLGAERRKRTVDISI
jgi:hypothetical protein